MIQEESMENTQSVLDALGRLVSTNLNRRRQIVQYRKKQSRTRLLMERSRMSVYEQLRHDLERKEQAIRELKRRRVADRTVIRQIRAQIQNMCNLPLPPHESLSPHDPEHSVSQAFPNTAVQPLA
jgi:hypothetical protein